MNPHYQRVLESDQQLPTPVRWLTRAMSSWWLILGLGVFVAGHIAFTLVPIGGRYLWQSPAVDAVRVEVLAWWPLHAAMVLLAAASLWSAFRRLPWRWANLGVFIAVIGLAITLVSQSIAWRFETTGVAAVPVTVTPDGGDTDATRLTYTTRYGDTAERVVVVMLGDNAPMSIAVPGLPRWHDAGEASTPRVALHDDPTFAAVLAFRARVTTAAYIADGGLKPNTDESETPTPTPTTDRYTTRTPYPANALLALKFEVDGEDGATHETIVWLPFEPEGADALVTRRFYDIKGLGTVGLAFRPASRKLPFALALSQLGPRQKLLNAWLEVADSDTGGQLLQPTRYHLHASLLGSGDTASHLAEDDDGRLRRYQLQWLEQRRDNAHALVSVTAQPAETVVLAGLATLGIGVLVIAVQVLLIVLRRTGTREDHKPADAAT